MHDELGQVFSGINIEVERIKNIVNQDCGKEQKEKIRHAINVTSRLSNQGVAAMRRIILNLRPAMLDDLGLVAAIEWQMEEFEKRSGISCTFVSNVEHVNMSNRYTVALFRIFQECLTNVAKHAGAAMVSVCVKFESGIFTMKIIDDGKGISEEDRQKRHSFGLLGIHERIRAIGGDAAVEAVPGGGTSVTVVAPLSLV